LALRRHSREGRNTVRLQRYFWMPDQARHVEHVGTISSRSIILSFSDKVYSCLAV